MSSLLARQYLALGDKFAQRHPHAWLVWEPGAWHAPAHDAASDATRLPSAATAPARPAKGDALCFELEPDARRPFLVLGRSPECEIVIPDATVSRRHVQLQLAGSAWQMQPCAESGATLVAGVRPATGGWAVLAAGQKLKLGDVDLTFLGAQQLMVRIEAEAQKLR